MKWNIALLATVLVAGLYAAEAKADPTVTIDSVDNKTAGQLTVTCKTQGVMGGWRVNSITVQARPPKGAAGQGGEKMATDTGGGVFAATLTTKADGLTSGNSYDVQAIMYTTDPAGLSHTIFSAVTAGQKVQ